MNAIAHRNLGNPANIMWAGAFEAKFVALRQVCQLAIIVDRVRDVCNVFPKNLDQGQAGVLHLWCAAPPSPCCAWL